MPDKREDEIEERQPGGVTRYEKDSTLLVSRVSLSSKGKKVYKTSLFRVSPAALLLLHTCTKRTFFLSFLFSPCLSVSLFSSSFSLLPCQHCDRHRPSIPSDKAEDDGGVRASSFPLGEP